MDFYRLPEQEIYSKLETSANGLSKEEAERRLKIYGLNEISEEKGIHPVTIFLSQFASPIVWILLVAMIISFVVKEMMDFYVIGAIVVLNAILGFVQEFRAEKAIISLKQMLSPKATVLRNGETTKIDATQLVLGDVIIIESGDRIPADARLIECVNTQTQEASLTGESTPVKKVLKTIDHDAAVADRVNMLFSGTDVTIGHGKAIVVGTGMKSEIGKIAKLIQEAKPTPTPLQKKLKHIGAVLGVLVVCIAIVVFGLGTLVGNPWLEMLLAGIALAVAAIPEGLPAVVTISLAMGVQRMAKKNALIRKLPSAETLGACTVICSDKTGTLTHNEMTVRKLFVNGRAVGVTGSGYSPEGHFTENSKSFELLLRIGALNNNAQVHLENSGWKVIGDPTEAALLVSAKKAGIEYEELHNKYPCIDEIPFSSERKRMTTVHKINNKNVSYMKGAPEVVLSLCNRVLIDGTVKRLTRQDKERIVQQNERFASNALRVIGFAYKDLVGVDAGDPEKGMIFAGLQAMIDPPRGEVKQAIEKCKTAGIQVVMITGDHAKTAEAIAKELGIGGRVITGLELDAMEDLKSEAKTIGVYARLNPAQKIRIVEAWQAHGEIVAMTGDGVNDAPAIKSADIGIAMGITGTDVAKDASEMVLADDNFASIVGAVEEGRRTYDNIQKYLAYLLSGNIGEVLVILSALLIGIPLPLIAIQILWTNLITDGLPALALGVDPAEPGVMQRKPRQPHRSIFKDLSHYLIVYPIFLTAGTMVLFSYYAEQGLTTGRTVAFTSLVLFELFQAISCRSLHKSVFKIGIFKNKWLWGAVLGSIVLQATIMYVPFLSTVFKMAPLALVDWLIIAGVASVGFIYLESHKLFVKIKE